MIISWIYQISCKPVHIVQTQGGTPAKSRQHKRHRALHLSRLFCLLSAWLTFAVALFALPVDAASLFSEDFNTATENPNLEGYSKFTVDDRVIRRNGSFSDLNDRRYMRTTATDYNDGDFRYELTFTTTHLTRTSINFIGLSSGDRRPGPSQFGHNEPWESLFFRIHTPNVDSGFVGISNHPATNLLGIGNIPTAGTHRARIDKIGNEITFAIDAHFSGTFVSDMSHTFTDLTSVAPFLDSTNSRLFFGTVLPDDSFDDFSVANPNSPSTLVSAIEHLVDDGLLNQGQGNSLLVKLNSNGNQQATLNRLGALIHQVDAFLNGGVLTDAEGQPLIDMAQALIDTGNDAFNLSHDTNFSGDFVGPINLAAIPEPSTLTLTACVLLGLAGCGRTRKERS